MVPNRATHHTCSFRASGKIVPAKSQLSSPTEYLLAFWELSGSIGKNTESTCFQVVLVRKLIMVSSKFLLPYHLYPILPHVGFRHHQHPQVPPLLFPLIPTIPTRMHFEGFQPQIKLAVLQNSQLLLSYVYVLHHISIFHIYYQNYTQKNTKIDSFSTELELNMIQETSLQLKSESIRRSWQCKFNNFCVFLVQEKIGDICKTYNIVSFPQKDGGR